MDQLTDAMTPQAPSRLVFLLLAPELIGWAFNIGLSGAALAIFANFRSSPHWDATGRKTRALMTAVVLCNTLHAVFNVAEVVYWSVVPDRSHRGLEGAAFVDVLPGITQAMITALVTGSLAERSMRLVQSVGVRILLSCLFLAGMLAEVAGSVSTSVVSFYLWKGQPDRLQGLTLNVALATYAVASACTDCLVTGTLYCCLRQELRVNGKEDGMARYVVRLAVRTAAYTAFFAVTGACLALAFPPPSDYTLLWNVFLFALPSLATLSLFTTLSSRHARTSPTTILHARSTTQTTSDRDAGEVSIWFDEWSDDRPQSPEKPKRRPAEKLGRPSKGVTEAFGKM